jgi:hypothetical protein
MESIEEAVAAVYAEMAENGELDQPKAAAQMQAGA